MGYERDGDMYVYDLGQKKETRLTSDATPTAYNGHFDWVYEERVRPGAGRGTGRPTAATSPTGVLDESAEPVVAVQRLLRFTIPIGRRSAFPSRGDSNPTVKIGVLDVRTGTRVWLDPGETGELLRAAHLLDQPARHPSR